jgi:hypothetical protein
MTFAAPLQSALISQPKAVLYNPHFALAPEGFQLSGFAPMVGRKSPSKSEGQEV